MKVLVTGGRGWIGSAVTRELGRRGHTAGCLDRSSGADITDAATVNEYIGNADHVIHLAGVLGTHELYDRPREAVEVNVLGSLTVIEACWRHDVGLTDIVMPDVNPSLYAATKMCALRVADGYQRRGLRVSHVCAYNVYGPGQAYGEGHPQKIVPTFASKAWAGEPVPVWGEGRLLVDLVHVDDVARVLVDALAFGHGERFDAGTGQAHQVINIARRVIGLTGGPSAIQHLPRRPGERLHSTDRDYANGAGWDLLGWQPVFDEERFAETVESYRPHPAESAA